jgi:hypothetical protein
MSIRYYDRDSVIRNKYVDLPVSVSGMTVTVGKGSFKILGTSYFLMEDEEVEIELFDTNATYFGWLVYDNEAEETRLFVDRAVRNGERRHDFEKDTRFHRLHNLFLLTVFPGITSLDDVEEGDFTVYRYVEVPEQRPNVP